MIISIDWDHTLRKMDGLDVNILILILYAQAKKIPIGLTTHRDIENTVLYTLYPWQNFPPINNQAALAAAISYWQQHVFTPLNIKFDFINARYQPLFTQGNYYVTTLLPLENKLADEIINKKNLENPQTVRAKISEYCAQAEPNMPDNQHKEKQIAWLYEQYCHLKEMPTTIIHLDDDGTLIDQLARNFIGSDNKEHNIHLKTVYVDSKSLLDNKEYLALLNEIGFIDYTKNLIDESSLLHHDQLSANPAAVLSGCLLLAQIYHAENNMLLKIKQLLIKLEPLLPSDLYYCFSFTKEFIATILIKNRPINLLANDLEHFLLM